MLRAILLPQQLRVPDLRRTHLVATQVGFLGPRPLRGGVQAGRQGAEVCSRKGTKRSKGVRQRRTSNQVCLLGAACGSPQIEVKPSIHECGPTT
jgi:hypothetical protein